ncbi:MAG: cytidylate kinase-like family protein [Elusimicrobia bacterium]|nr:cytidylate kinase-like family protein [Elusimicrobiota bacterium]
MTDDLVLRFLKSQAAPVPGSPGHPAGRRPFLTVSRQAGAGGRSVAQAVVRALEKEGEELWRGWQLFDQELCRLVAKEPRLRVSLASLLDEEYRSPLADLVTQLVARVTPQEIVLHRVFQTIRSVARGGKAVIVGRAGCLVTKDLPCGVHVRIVAPFEFRVGRIAERRGLSLAGAEDWAASQDLARRRLFSNRFHKDIENPCLYDAVFNSANVSPEEIAAQIVPLLKGRRSRVDAEPQEAL